jgi:hypothetical protein
MSSNFFSNADAYENFMGRYSRVLAPEFARAAGVEAGSACSTSAAAPVH